MILLNPIPDCDVVSLDLRKNKISFRTLFRAISLKNTNIDHSLHYFEGVLFLLVIIKEIEHLQAIGLSLNEQKIL